MSMIDSRDGSPTFATAYTLVYLSIRGGDCFAFPCDKAGTVEMNGLSDRARDDYLLARALVGRDFHSPTVVCRPADRIEPRVLETPPASRPAADHVEQPTHDALAISTQAVVGVLVGDPGPQPTNAARRLLGE